jgi:hypothetical protein
MAFYDIADAIYGTGKYGAASYGIVTPVIALTGVQATGAITSVTAGGFEIDITERISTGVGATGAVNTVQVHIAELLASVSATGSVNTLTLTGTANVTLTGVEGTGFVNTVEDKPTELLGSVSATGFVNGNFTFSNTHSLTGIQGTTVIGTITKTAVIFDFEAVASQYSRSRTVNIARAA